MDKSRRPGNNPVKVVPYTANDHVILWIRHLGGQQCYYCLWQHREQIFWSHCLPLQFPFLIRITFFLPPRYKLREHAAFRILYLIALEYKSV